MLKLSKQPYNPSHVVGVSSNDVFKSNPLPSGQFADLAIIAHHKHVLMQCAPFDTISAAYAQSS